MDYEQYLIKEYNHWKVYLHTNQYYLGRVYIWAKNENAIDLMQINEIERNELFAIGNEINNALKKLFNYDLMSYIVQGQQTKHLHVHFIPRYSNARVFEGIKFTDEQWGKSYSANNNFDIPEEVKLKLVDEIKKAI